MRQVVKAGVKKGIAASKKAAGKVDAHINKTDYGPAVMAGFVGLPAIAVGKKYLSEKDKKAKNPRGGKPMKGSK